MRGLAKPAAVVLCGLLLAGCFEGKADVTFNPDGSGKIVGSVLFPLEQPWTNPVRTLGSGKDATTVDIPPDEAMKDAVSSLIKKSRGIETWKDVQFQRLGGGRVRFQGTAYFKDFSKVKIFPSTAMAFFFGQEKPGSLSLVLSRPADKADPAVSTKQPPSAEVMEKRVKEERLKYNKIRPTVGLLVHTMKLTVDFRAPGTAAEKFGFEQARGALAWNVDGQKLLQAIDSSYADGISLRQMILAGESLGDGSFSKVEKSVYKRIFGPQGDTWARLTGDFHARFDYKAEVDEAKKAYPDMMANLGLDKPRAAPAGRKPPADDDPGKPPRLKLPEKLPDIPVPILPGL